MQAGVLRCGGRLNLLDDGKGRDRYCGSCADTRSADEHSR